MAASFLGHGQYQLIQKLTMEELNQPRHRFIMKEKIEEGSQAAVFKATERSTGRPFAIKRLVASAKFSEKYILSELAILRKLKHKNIVAFHSSHQVSASEYWLVMEQIPRCLLDALN